MDFFKNLPKFDFIAQQKKAFILSGTLILVSVLAPFVRAPNWGVDFAGGTELQVKFSSEVDPVELRRSLQSHGISDANIQRFGSAEANEVLIRLGRSSLFSNDQFETEVAPKIREQLPSLRAGSEGLIYDEAEGDQVTVLGESGLSTEGVRSAFEDAGYRVLDVRQITEGTQYSVVFRGVSDRVELALAEDFASLNPQVLRIDQVGAAVGSELTQAAIKSMLLAIVLILLYVGFRFDFRFAPGGVVALAHDTIIVIGFYVVSGAEINTTTIAAFLTVVGYSINDTIVIFDRVRENQAASPGVELRKVINDSINETLSRSILTSLTTSLSLIGLIIFTVGTLREFASAMLVGVIVGAYSSIFVANPMVLWIDQVLEARKTAAAAAPAK